MAEIVRAYGAANDLDVIEVDPPGATIGIAATGTTFDSVRQALLDLGADDVALHHAGIRLLRIGMPTRWGRTPSTNFADGLDEILVVEDKTAFVETQVREILYGEPSAPRILGKKDAAGRPLIPVDGELTAGRLLAPLRRVLAVDWSSRRRRRRRSRSTCSPPSAPPTSAAAARTTARPPCPRARSPAAASAATPW